MPMITNNVFQSLFKKHYSKKRLKGTSCGLRSYSIKHRLKEVAQKYLVQILQESCEGIIQNDIMLYSAPIYETGAMKTDAKKYTLFFYVILILCML